MKMTVTQEHVCVHAVYDYVCDYVCVINKVES